VRERERETGQGRVSKSKCVLRHYFVLVSSQCGHTVSSCMDEVQVYKKGWVLGYHYTKKRCGYV